MSPLRFALELFLTLSLREITVKIALRYLTYRGKIAYELSETYYSLILISCY
jgi:hypothetical protein